MSNLFDRLPSSLPDEWVEVLAESDQVRIERIVSTGQTSPCGFWYDQDEHEWVTVLQGRATLSFEDGDELKMAAGDHVLITAHRRHRVEWTSPEEETVWLAVFFK